MLRLIKNKRVINDKLKQLKDHINTSKVYSPKTISKFIFLCGANQSEGKVSARRQALINFAKQHLPHTQFFLAEKVFHTLIKEGHSGNIIDVEHKISLFADHVLIVLESNSAFAELGAFCNFELRKKLIVVNDSKYKSAQSFINLGPIKAIEEANGKKNIVTYEMADDGCVKQDLIADTFNPIFELLKEPAKNKVEVLKLDSCNPSTTFNKYSAMFIHDLVFFTGPILHAELIEVVIQIFGPGNYNKLSETLGMLVSFDSLTRNEKGLYRSNIGKTYYEYRCNTDSLVAIFRNHLLKYFPERIYEH